MIKIACFFGQNKHQFHGETLEEFPLNFETEQ